MFPTDEIAEYWARSVSLERQIEICKMFNIQTLGSILFDPKVREYLRKEKENE
jgi:hypothetical protein